LELDDVFVVEQVQHVRLKVCCWPVRFLFERLHRELGASLFFDDQLDDSAGAFSDVAFDFVLVQEADVRGRRLDAVLRDACFFVEGFEEAIAVGVGRVLSVSFR
jgi:hypothetical protein